MAYPTRRALRLAGQEEQDANSPPNGEPSNGKIIGRRRDSRDESGTEDEEVQTDLIGGLRRSKRIHLSRYRSINKGILVAQAIPLEEMTEIDMYSRVKSGARQHFNDDGLRVRRPRAVGTNGTADSAVNGGEMNRVNGEVEMDEGEEEEEEVDSEPEESRGYNLRRHRSQPQFFVIEQSEPRRRVHVEAHPRHSHAHHHHVRRLSHARSGQLHSPGDFSSTPNSSSDSDLDRSKRDLKAPRGVEDDPEMRFERRRVRSMACARRDVLPVNFTNTDLEILGLKDRIRAGQTVADIDPMYIDKTTTFEQIGGLDCHIRQLKEMVVFPLLYPEMFSQFGITPPRGVLFFGPPGTGKTLLARALANECSRAGGKRVAFFCRRGADCLSKWVGESERQLRLLFDQAYQLRPSIIFFDEIDGLAPVRSSRQDQIHSSIVSTLLALMDGLDSRQEVVVIGATNRIDSIDPALRRPGRFDREFLFRLPNKAARREIVQIHTRSWQPALSSQMVDSLADRTVGFSGADLQGLCTEAVLNAVRRRYPQIYSSRDRLLIDPSQLRPMAVDFQGALQRLMPTAARAKQPLAWPLTETIRPLLTTQFHSFLVQLAKNFPLFTAIGKDEEEGLPAAGSEQPASNAGTSSNGANCSSAIFKPRILLCGRATQGHVSHVAPAALHALEDFQVHALSIASVFGGIDFRQQEDAVHFIITEAIRTAPSVLYMPDFDQFLAIASCQLKAVLQLALESIKPDLPILLFATIRQASIKALSHLSIVRELFRPELGQIFDMLDPDATERRTFFAPLFKLKIHVEPPVAMVSQPSESASGISSSTGSLTPTSAVPSSTFPPPPPPQNEQLPLAPPQLVAVQLSDTEKASLFLKEEVIFREMRGFLRDILTRLLRDRRFGVFARPVDREDAPDYYDIIATPMDLSQMMSKIDRHEYASVGDFVSDIDLIARNALEYNPETDTNSRAVRHRACALRDVCAGMIDNELDPEFERQCLEIKQSRLMRGIDAKKTAPAFIYTPASAQLNRPNSQNSQQPNANSANAQQTTSPQPHPASATVALVHMQQAIARGEMFPSTLTEASNPGQMAQQSGGFQSPVNNRTRELRASTLRQSAARPITFTSPNGGGAKRRRVDNSLSSTSVQSAASSSSALMVVDEPVQLSTCPTLTACGSPKQQEQFDGLLDQVASVATVDWSVDELHRLFMALVKVANSHTSASDLFEHYEAVINSAELQNKS